MDWVHVQLTKSEGTVEEYSRMKRTVMTRPVNSVLGKSGKRRARRTRPNVDT